MLLHTGISRLRAEELLLAAKEDGSFLIRDSESLTGAYVLCLLWKSRIHQYRILPQKDGKLSVQSQGKVQAVRYNDINELVHGYMQRGDQNGLVGALKKPVLPEKQDGASLDSDDDDYDEADFSPDVFAPPLPNESDDKYLTRTFKYNYLSNFSRLDLSNCDGAFVDSLKNYIDSGLEKDATNYQKGDQQLSEFQKLLQTAGAGLQRELDMFLLKMSICSDILSQTGGVKDKQIFGQKDADNSDASSVSLMVEKLGLAKKQLLEVDKKAHDAVQNVPNDSYCYLDGQELQDIRDQLQESAFELPRATMHIPLATFEVKVTKPGKLTSKMTLTVDLKQGRMHAVKPTKDFLDSSNNFSHNQILQLIKNTADNSRLDIIIEGKKKTTYYFENAHTRENFCLQIQQMKSLHSTNSEVDQISIFIGTWNMGNSSPVNILKSWLTCEGDGKCHDSVMSKIPHDIYVIGTQETGASEKDWVNRLKSSLRTYLNLDVDLLESSNLWGLRLVILINPVHRNVISHVQKSSVKTGIANTLGNKGATAISFQFNGTSLCFINAHLTSGDERLERRNNNFRDILKGLSLGVKNLEGFDVTHKFHHVFFFGDLNYRLNEKIDVILKKTDEGDVAFLLEKDQLRKTQFKKNAFYGFSESEITFLPTYRLYRQRPGYSYDWKKIRKTGKKDFLSFFDDIKCSVHSFSDKNCEMSKEERINVPSWCDRILWHSYPGTFIENHAYGTATNLLNSDHRPVFGSFTIGIASQFVQNRASILENSTIKILFKEIRAQVKTCNKQHFILEFYSSCLPNIICCESNSKFDESVSEFSCCPVWVKDNLPELTPLFNSREFLEEQHILIAVRSSGDDDESYGECVISLKNMFSPEFQHFDAVLTHNGEETGKIRGEMRISMGGKYKVGKNRKTYEIVALDTEYQDPEEFLSGFPRQASKSEAFIQPPVYENTSQMKTRPASPVPPPRSRQSSEDMTGIPSDHHLNISSSATNSTSAGKPANGPTATQVNGPGGKYANVPTGIQASGPTGKQTAPRRSKPIMGQSVLQASQWQVMPVVSSASNISTTRCSEPSFSSETSARQGLDEKKSNLAPPLPRKQKHLVTEVNYEGLNKPTTVQDWLSGIGLEELLSVFLKHGWDNISRLPTLTAHELMRMGIQSTEHRNRIMISLQDL